MRKMEKFKEYFNYLSSFESISILSIQFWLARVSHIYGVTPEHGPLVLGVKFTKRNSKYISFLPCFPFLARTLSFKKHFLCSLDLLKVFKCTLCWELHVLWHFGSPKTVFYLILTFLLSIMLIEKQVDYFFKFKIMNDYGHILT